MKLLFVHDARKPEISNEKIGVVFGRAEQQILRLQVAVNNAVVMQICDSGESGANKVGGVGLVV